MLNKIKEFFKRLFCRENRVALLQEKNEREFSNGIVEKRNIMSDRVKKETAEKLIKDKSYIEKLSDEEVEEMISFFESDIEEIDKKISSVKERLINIRNKF